MSHSTLHVSPFGGVSYNEIEKPGFEEILKNVSLSADFNQNMYACLKLTNDIIYVVAASYSIIFMSFDSILFCGKKPVGVKLELLTNKPGFSPTGFPKTWHTDGL